MKARPKVKPRRGVVIATVGGRGVGVRDAGIGSFLFFFCWCVLRVTGLKVKIGKPCLESWLLGSSGYRLF